MIKVAILIASCAMIASVSGLCGVWKQPIDHKSWTEIWSKGLNDSSSCIFFRSLNELSCAGYSKPIKSCAAHFDFSELDENLFDKFFIGIDDNEKVELNAESVGYHLYPKLTNVEGYMDWRITLGANASSFSLYNDMSKNHLARGIHVVDSKCFQELVSYFSSFNKTEIVSLQSYLLVKPKALKIAQLHFAA